MESSSTRMVDLEAPKILLSGFTGLSAEARQKREASGGGSDACSDLFNGEESEMKLKNSMVAAVVTVALCLPAPASSEPVAVRHAEGLVHGFLSLRSPEGKLLASGDLIQRARGDQVTSRLVFHFADGSTHDETAVFRQRGQFLLLSGRLVQKGPAFKQAIDMNIDRQSGQVTVNYTDEHGEQKSEVEHMELPPDLANGLIITLLKNVRRNAMPKSFSYVAATPKPRLVQFALSVAGQEPFIVAGSRRQATHYVLKVEIGGVAGVIAPLIGKQPEDSHIWILEGEAPAFVKSQASMFMGGPLWRTDLVSPVWK
jgi:hypothetical protein